ncbi:SDR family NAD(P)-dependent oxidoreductase [Mycobacterium camsae]|uniref:SDR family NAD(P)-dependent oxidoreductase n=1 Tax=Mycobacterium gordonae TaxID=1778 RepID=UPI00197DBFF4|nr:SDR family oxidoreductase [Mycobacterium gordonae]
MDLHLADKIAVVTGASKGIGLAVTKALVGAGAHVVAGSRTPGKELPAMEEAGQVTYVSVDLSRPQHAEELIGAAARRGGIDLLVNNVGSATPRPGGFVGITDGDWQASWDLNMMGIVRPTRAALPQIQRRGGGSIVIIGSINAYYPGAVTYDYCATKAAVTNLAKALSKELGPLNIRVNSISPGLVLTEKWTEDGLAEGLAEANGEPAQDVLANILEDTPTGRFTTREQVADLVLFLASERAGNINGSDYRIDGGFVPTL